MSNKNSTTELVGPYYDITGLNLRDLVRIVFFEVSSKDMGLAAHLAPFVPRLSDEEADKFISPSTKCFSDKYGVKTIIDMHEVQGHSCKLQAYGCNGKILLPAHIYDQSDVSRDFYAEWGLNQSNKVGIEKSCIEQWFLKRYKAKVIPWKRVSESVGAN